MTITSQPKDVINTRTQAGVAQRKRAGLITLRSQDRNLSPVCYNLLGLQNRVVIAHAT